jgi:2-dehydro-3-deoxyphosphogluconate aldolase/(4S)-4-hydroxy-2-oxoglutarate aldolase
VLVNKAEVRARIEEIGIIPAIRVSSAEDALFAAEAVLSGGIPIIEVTMTVPGALEVVTDLVRHGPDVLVGAGTVLDVSTAQRCINAGAHFLTSTGFDSHVVGLAVEAELAVFPGALTPTEVIAAWKAGSDLVKIFPCSQVGGPAYIRALRAPFPQVSLIAAGGVNQQTAADFIDAGAVALGIGNELVPHQAVRHRRADWIAELSRRFLGMVRRARNHDGL